MKWLSEEESKDPVVFWNKLVAQGVFEKMSN